MRATQRIERVAPLVPVLVLGLCAAACERPGHRSLALGGECNPIEVLDRHPIIPVTIDAVEYPFAITGGEPPYTIEVVGDLPDGLEVDPGGALVGSPTEIWSGDLVLVVQDSVGTVVEAELYLEVVPPAIPYPEITSTRILTEDDRHALAGDPHWEELTEGLRAHELEPARELAMHLTMNLEGDVREMTFVPTFDAERRLGLGAIVLARPGDPEADAFALYIYTDETGARELRVYGGGGILGIGVNSSLFMTSVDTILAGDDFWTDLLDWALKVLEKVTVPDIVACIKKCKAAYDTGESGDKMSCLGCITKLIMYCM